MKTYLNFLLITFFTLAFASCNQSSQVDDQLEIDNDSATYTSNSDTAQIDADSLEDDYRFDDVFISDGVIGLESFQNKFAQDFDHKFDFGWRYITANYDEYPEDTLLMHTETDLTFDLQKVTHVELERDIYPVNFDGFAHSYQPVNGGFIYVTYVQAEISEELHYYYVNEVFEIIEEGILASNGGDEGSWSYSYSEFSEDFSVYNISSVSGEGLDTFDFNTEAFWLF